MNNKDFVRNFKKLNNKQPEGLSKYENNFLNDEDDNKSDTDLELESDNDQEDENFNHEETLHHLVKVSSIPENKMFLIDECFKHAKNGWIYVTTAGESVDQELVEKINQRVNVDMKRLSVVKPYDDFNGLLFSTPLFKILNGNHKKAHETDDGELEFDSRPFLEKIEDMKDNTGETLITWEEFNAS